MKYLTILSRQGFFPSVWEWICKTKFQKWNWKKWSEEHYAWIKTRTSQGTCFARDNTHLGRQVVLQWPLLLKKDWPHWGSDYKCKGRQRFHGLIPKIVFLCDYLEDGRLTTEEQLVSQHKHGKHRVPPSSVVPRSEKDAPEQMVGQTKALVCWASVLAN